MGSRSRCPPGLESSREVGVRVGIRTINKLILKRDREFLQLQSRADYEAVRLC